MMEYWLWFAQLKGLSNRQKRELLDRLGTPEDLYWLTPRELNNLNPKAAEALAQKDLTQARELLTRCREKQVKFLTYSGSLYPAALKTISDPPLVLYCLGTLPPLGRAPAIGVVGTRRASGYGLTAARRFGGQLAACGGIVISGAASGVDTEAMLGALDAGGKVVGVLGCGIDQVYPKSNKALYRRVRESGCLISEYPPDTPAYTWNFPRRNRIISGLSDGVLVVEAPEKSGALITAREAQDQGRDIFVIPGNLGVESCVGSNGLLRQGATAVFEGYDILQTYENRYPGQTQRREVPVPRWNGPLRQEPAVPAAPAAAKKTIDNREKPNYSVLDKQLSGLSDQERALLALLKPEPQLLDQVIADSGLPAGKALSLLTMLEMRGMVKSHPGRRISL